MGCPFSGKSSLAKYLKKYLAVPTANVKGLILNAGKHKNLAELAKKIKHQIEEIKDRIIEENITQKKKGADLDRESLKIDIQNPLIAEILKHVMKQPKH